MSGEIQNFQSSSIVNNFLNQNVAGFEQRENTDQNIFDIAANSEAHSDNNTLNRDSYMTDLRFDPQHWEQSGAKKVESRKESGVICDKYQYEDGSYSIVYSKPGGLLNKLFTNQAGEITKVEDFGKDGNKLTETSSDGSGNWNVTTFDDEGNKDISLSYIRFKNGDYIRTKDYNSNGTGQAEDNHFEERYRDDFILQTYFREAENTLEGLNKGTQIEINELEYRDINKDQPESL